MQKNQQQKIKFWLTLIALVAIVFFIFRLKGEIQSAAPEIQKTINKLDQMPPVKKSPTKKVKSSEDSEAQIITIDIVTAAQRLHFIKKFLKDRLEKIHFSIAQECPPPYKRTKLDWHPQNYNIECRRKDKDNFIYKLQFLNNDLFRYISSENKTYKQKFVVTFINAEEISSIKFSQNSKNIMTILFENNMVQDVIRNEKIIERNQENAKDSKEEKIRKMILHAGVKLTKSLLSELCDKYKDKIACESFN